MKTLLLTFSLTFIVFISDGQFVLHQMPAGYTGPQLRPKNGLALDQNNNYWIAFDKIGLGKYDGSAWTMYDTLNSDILDNRITEVIIDNQNKVIATTAKGLSIFDGSVWQNFDNNNSPLPVGFTSTVTLLNNILWIGAANGLHNYDGSNWTSYTTAQGLVDDSVTCIAFAPDGSAWIGTYHGISHFSNGTWTNYTIANGALTNETVKSIAVNGNGEPWYTTPTGSCFHYDNNTGNFETLSDFLPDPLTGCYDFNPTTYTEVIRSDSSIYFILREPAPSAAGGGFSLIKIDPSNTITHSYVTVGATALLPLQMIYNNGNFAVLSPWHLASQPTFYTGPVAPLSFLSLDNNYVGRDWLDVNNVSTLLQNRGDMHWDPIGQSPYYNIPACSGQNTVYASALWLGGYDQNNTLHTAAHTYRQMGGTDFWTGPLDTITGNIDSATVVKYNRFWKLNKITLDDFIYNYQQGNVTNGTYAIPEVILNWPAHGGGNYTHDLAPFFDNNADGNYNPYDGDYPVMTGDQQLWWVFNDAFGVHGETGGPAFNFEIHAKAYAYNCNALTSDNEPINYTTFYQYKIINRSQNTYHDMYIGLWVDNDLGNASDDYVGCNVPLNTGICYNADNDDDGSGGYGLKPPYQNITILKGPVTDGPDGFDNNHNGVIDETNETIGMTTFHHYISANNDPTSNPVITDDYYQYLNAEWLDGQHITYGGNGRDLSNPPCNYMYPGTTDPSFPGQNWAMATAGIQGDDMRYVMSSGKFTIAPGESRTIDFAYIYSRDTVGNWPSDAEAKNISDINKIIYWYNNNLLSSCPPPVSVNELNGNHNTIAVYPMPAKNILNVDRSKLQGKCNFNISDVTGKTCLNNVLIGNSIDISSLDAGSYFLKVSNESVIYTAKFVKL